jgi:lon-related putative ATP-dependent protease
MAITKLEPRLLRKSINLGKLSFETTNDLEPLSSVIGQDRAIKAIRLALDMNHSGYNVFVTGMSGTGRTTIVTNILKKIAQDKAVPSDWIYVFNFDDPDSPIALELPPGKAKEFQQEMEDLIETLKKEIPERFSSEDYEKQKIKILNKNQEQKRKLLTELEKTAVEQDVLIQNTPTGFQTVVLKNKQPIKPEEYEALSDQEKEKVNQRVEVIQKEINETMRQVVKLDRETQQEVRELNEKVARFIVLRNILEIRAAYEAYPEVVNYLDQVNSDIIKNIKDFITHSKEEPEKEDMFNASEEHFKRYKINIIVDNGNVEGAPVIYEPNPTYNNLFGRIEKQTIMGARVTDFTLIKNGSLHRANGGFLMTEAFHVLKNPFVYDALKRAIKMREIRIEDLQDLSGIGSAATLRPQSIPLNLKVILIGWNQIYYALQAYDQDFAKIFKIRADFDYETEANQDNLVQYSRYIKKICDEEKLLPFHRNAIKEIVQYGHTLVDNQNKLSLQFGSLVSVIREANFYAKSESKQYVEASQIKKAIKEHRNRHGLVEEKIQEMYKKDIFQIDTTGDKIGQINGLAVYVLGDYSYGRPNKITAKTYIGSENLINIERKARLSGKIHDKGLLILNGFFNSKFGQYMPLNFSASLTFEQSYSMIDGDSASSTELYALISSLADSPIKQGIAVTGSVNQNGEIQPIGGVNQKIEGFYKVCKDKGLNGQQGVIIPQSNLENLMLDEEVVRAVRQNKFNIWAIDTIEDGLKILTGIEPGIRQKNHKFPKNSIYGKVEDKLTTYAKRAAKFRKSFDSKPEAKSRAKTNNEENQKNSTEE